MNRVYKYPIDLPDIRYNGILKLELDLPEGADILSCELYTERLNVWVVVNTDEHIKQKHSIVIAWAGIDLPTWCTKQTLLDKCVVGSLVYHVFIKID